MGTKFDDFTELAWANHYVVYKDDKTIRGNRRILYWVMTDTGFTNLPFEWGHYD